MSTTVVVVSPAELAELIRAAVEQAVTESSQDTGPLLLDRSGIAKALGVGTSSIDRFRKAGMPAVWVGDSPRFLADECISWLRDHRREPPAEDATTSPSASNRGENEGNRDGTV